MLRDGKKTETILTPKRTADGWAYGIALLQKPVIGRTLSEEFMPGDVVVAIDGIPVSSTYDIYSYGKESFTLTIERDGKLMERYIEGGSLPFAWKSGTRISRDSYAPLMHAVERSSELFISTLSALGAFLTFHFEEALEVITGPVKAAESIVFRRTLRRFGGWSQSEKISAQGRITVPQMFKEHAGLKNGADVIVAGVEIGVELWSVERWEEEQRRIGEHMRRKSEQEMEQDLL